MKRLVILLLTIASLAGCAVSGHPFKMVHPKPPNGHFRAFAHMP